MLSFIAVVGGLISLGAPGVMLGQLRLAVTLTLVQIWRRQLADRIEGVSMIV
ncbi:hypothetical protein [Bradyrhizobium sp. CCBAU 11386]|uniref:hypothetical protein n=1 Tax=Bradyrhizobium sp. CCBAU 11386 TaxID=1630837 RepID=UPI002303C28F|nr:hypothetical protein [Bradyrhizobium sp. CCBAU 11386]